MIVKVFFAVFGVEILFKTTKGLYRISPIARHTDCIFWELIPCSQAFYIKEMKLALSRLYIINRVFSANNVL